MINRFTSTMAIALLAFASAPALAQNTTAPPANADKTQVQPDKGDLKPDPATVEKMDDNAQRIHDRDRDAAAQGKAPDAQGNAQSNAQGNAQGEAQGNSQGNAQANAGNSQQARPSQGDVRDWSAVDKNSDNLISPEEMEAALKETSPQASKPK